MRGGTFAAPALDLLSALVPSSGAFPGGAALTMPRPLPGEISCTGGPSGGSSLHGASQDHMLRIMFWMSAGTSAAHTALAWWWCTMHRDHGVADTLTHGSHIAHVAV